MDGAQIIKSPSLQPLLVYGEHDEKKSPSIDISFTLPITPPLDSFPVYGQIKNRLGVGPALINFSNNENYYSDFAIYFKNDESTAYIKFGIKNNGNMVARDVKAVVDFQNLPVGSSVFHERHLPEPPERLSSVPIQKLITTPQTYHLVVEERPVGHGVEIKFGKIQSKDTSICKERLCVLVTKSCQISARFTIYSDDLDSPVTAELIISMTANEKVYSVEEIIGLTTTKIF